MLSDEIEITHHSFVGGCGGWGAPSTLGKGGALSTLGMHVCENGSTLGMGEHGDRGAPSMLRVGGGESSASGVSEQWGRVASILGDGGDTI